MEIKKICAICGNQFIAHQKIKTICSTNCQKVIQSHNTFPEGSEYVECKICGFRAKQLMQHIKKVHKMNITEYCKKYGITEYGLMTESQHTLLSNNSLNAQKVGKCGWQKGEKNPAHDEECITGRRSAWSMNYKGYDGLSNEQKSKKIFELSKRAQSTMNSNYNNPLRVDFYTTRGYSEEEAKKLLTKRQCTFSLDKCIEKYGKE